VFLLTPFSCNIPASNHAVSLLSFLEHHSAYSVLPKERLISLYRVSELSSENFAKIFYLAVLLHPSFTVFISLKLQFCCFMLCIADCNKIRALVSVMNM
jgi:hypothetical protein